MRFIRPFTALALGSLGSLSLLSFGLTGCASEGADASVATATPIPLGAAAAAFSRRDAIVIDSRGNTWARRGEAKFSQNESRKGSAEVLPEEARSRAIDVESLTDEEWIENLRPVRLVGTTEYVMTSFSREAARRARYASRLGWRKNAVAGSLEAAAAIAPAHQMGALVPFWLTARAPAFGSAGRFESEIPVETRQIIGSDNRTYVAASSVVGVSSGQEYAPMVNFRHSTYQCSGAMMGPSAVLTAGHCLYDGGWIPNQSWEIGAVRKKNVNGGTTATVAVGAVSNCGFPEVPNARLNNNPDLYYDFAKLDLTDDSRCPNTQPGYTTGWLALGANGQTQLSDQQISGATVRVSGYPASFAMPAQTNQLTPYVYPTLVTFGGPNTAGYAFFSAPGSHLIRHWLDTGGGQSGAPLVQPLGGFMTISGIHLGNETNNTTRNTARRVDNAVANFVFDGIEPL